MLTLPNSNEPGSDRPKDGTDEMKTKTAAEPILRQDGIVVGADGRPTVGTVNYDDAAKVFGATLPKELKRRISETIQILKAEFPTAHFLVEVDENDQTMEEILTIQIQDDQDVVTRTLKLASIHPKLPVKDTEVIVVG
jgi:hypothetical protein